MSYDRVEATVGEASGRGQEDANPESGAIAQPQPLVSIHNIYSQWKIAQIR